MRKESYDSAEKENQKDALNCQRILRVESSVNEDVHSKKELNKSVELKTNQNVNQEDKKDKAPLPKDCLTREKLCVLVDRTDHKHKESAKHLRNLVNDEIENLNRDFEQIKTHIQSMKAKERSFDGILAQEVQEGKYISTSVIALQTLIKLREKFDDTLKTVRTGN